MGIREDSEVGDPNMGIRGDPNMGIRGDPDVGMREDSEVGDPDVGMRGDPDVVDPEHPKVGVRGDPKVEVRGDPKSRELEEQIDSDGQSDSDECEETDGTPLSHKVHDQTSENIHEVQTLNSSNDSDRYMLSFRYNRGQPSNRYSPD